MLLEVMAVAFLECDFDRDRCLRRVRDLERLRLALDSL